MPHDDHIASLIQCIQSHGNDSEEYVTFHLTKSTLRLMEISRSRALAPYVHMARWLPSAIGPFMDVESIFYAGVLHMNGSEPEYVFNSIYMLVMTYIFFISRTDEEENNIKLFNIIIRLCPKLKKVIKGFDGDEDLMKDFLRIVSQNMRIYFIICNTNDPSQLSTASSNSRTEDTGVLKPIIADYINLDPSEPVTKAPKNKSDRGFKHEKMARLLCPLSLLQEFDADPE